MQPALCREILEDLEDGNSATREHLALVSPLLKHLSGEIVAFAQPLPASLQKLQELAAEQTQTALGAVVNQQVVSMLCPMGQLQSMCVSLGVGASPMLPRLVSACSQQPTVTGLVALLLPRTGTHALPPPCGCWSCMCSTALFSFASFHSFTCVVLWLEHISLGTSFACLLRLPRLPTQQRMPPCAPAHKSVLGIAPVQFLAAQARAARHIIDARANAV